MNEQTVEKLKKIGYTVHAIGINRWAWYFKDKSGKIGFAKSGYVTKEDALIGAYLAHMASVGYPIVI